MRIVRKYQGLAAEDRAGAAAAIGNFDGVHLGHQSVLNVAREAAHRAGAPLAAVTFEPHPKELFKPGAAPFRLMNAEARANRFGKLGVDILYELPFDTAIASLSAEDFAGTILARGLGLSHVVTGPDFRFGKDRRGDTDALGRLGPRLGFETIVAPLLETDGVEVSSTRIRAALSEGRPDRAAEMLGHFHRIEGPVIKGDQRGRELGYPTANMSIAGLHPPRFGVYAVWADVLAGPHKGRYPAVASLGVRPMFGENVPNIETFIFDFEGDLYGTHLSIALVEFLRDELKFDGLDALIEQMDRDSENARAALR
ncbi:MAG: bifunctional riboflavin kinase/FAD synthetase [Pseudomonadota bacterium]